MSPNEFKAEMKILKGWLNGKTIKITLVTQKEVHDYSFKSLKGFGTAILAFEEMGALFGFVKVGNSKIQKSAKDIKEFKHWINNGVWTNVHFFATTVK